MTENTVLFKKTCLIGIGLIGSSLAKVLKSQALTEEIAIWTRRAETLEEAKSLDLGTSYHTSLEKAVRDADLVIFCVPVRAYATLGMQIAPYLKQGSIISDVGSVKQTVIRDLQDFIPKGVHFVPAHPIAGTEHSGPSAGFAELFQNRWCILTPPAGTDEGAIEDLSALWRKAGSMIEVMDAAHHDQVLAITSHLPHLIAYTIVGTAIDLETSLQQEVIKFSASGFRDFTRIAASDPIMWRDIFLNNREAVLEILQRFTEDLTALQRAIRWEEGETLEKLFTQTRIVRKNILDIKQN